MSIVEEFPSFMLIFRYVCKK